MLSGLVREAYNMFLHAATYTSGDKFREDVLAVAMAESKPRQFSVRRLMGIVFAVAVYCAAWRAAGKFRPMLAALTAIVLTTVGTLYWLDKKFPPPPPPRIPKNDDHHII